MRGVCEQIKVIKAKEKELEEEMLEFLKENEDRLKKAKDFIDGLKRNVERAEKGVVVLEKKCAAAQNLIKAVAKPVNDIYGRVEDRRLTPSLRNALTRPFVDAEADMTPNDGSVGDTLAILAVVDQVRAGRILQTPLIRSALWRSIFPSFQS